MKFHQIHSFILLPFFVFCVIFTLFTLQTTFAKFAKFATVNDTATAAKFDLEILPPSEFNDGKFHHYFLSNEEIKILDFEMSNNGETDLVCVPTLSGGLNYSVFSGGEEKSELILPRHEALSFQMHIFANGLTATPTTVDFYIDVTQFEGEQNT